MRENQEKVNVFISYAKDDEKWVKKELLPRLDEAGLSYADQYNYHIGAHTLVEINRLSGICENVILVFSPAYFESQLGVYENLVVLTDSIISKKWRGIPLLIQKYHLPNYLSPFVIADLTKGSEEVWEQVFNTLKASYTPKPKYHLNYAPSHEGNFVQRPKEIEKILSLLMSNTSADPVAITSATALTGAGGFGKTAIAQYICHLPVIAETYSDGVLWVTITQDGKVLEGLTKLYHQITDERSTFVDEENVVASLSTALKGRKVLIVIDDVWEYRHIRPFLQATSGNRLLITTRNRGILPYETQKVEVDQMEKSEALELLGFGLLDVYLQDFLHLAKRLGDWPQIIKIANGYLRDRIARGDNLEHALDLIYRKLDKDSITALDSTSEAARTRTIAAVLELSLGQLESAQKARYFELAVFPEDLAISLDTLNVFWGYTGALDDIAVEELCERLFNLSLLRDYDIRNHTIRLHDVMRQYLIKNSIDTANYSVPYAREKIYLPDLHRKLIDSFALSIPKELRHSNKDPRATTNSEAFQLWQYAKNAEYLFEHIAFHFFHGMYWSHFELLLSHYDWLRAKLNATNINTLLSDYDLFLTNVRPLMKYTHQGEISHNDPIPLIHAALRLSAHVLTQDKEQFPSQLWGRLISFQENHSEIFQLLKAPFSLEESPWLRPTTPSLEPADGLLICNLIGHTQSVTAVAVTPDNQTAVSVSDDNTLKVWDVTSGQEVRTLRGRFYDRFHTLAITADGQTIVTASERTLYMWDLVSGQILRELEGHTSFITAIALTSNGKTVVSASNDNTLKVWDLASGQELRTLKGHTRRVTAVAITSNNKIVVSASDDDTLRVWNLSSGQQLQFLFKYFDRVNFVALTSDGQTIVSASDNGTLMVWDDLTGGQEPRTLKGHTTSVTAVAVTPDNQAVISASCDHTLKVWDLASGQELRTLRGHTNCVTAIALTSDGNTAISASEDHTLKVWNLRSRQVSWIGKQHNRMVIAVFITSDNETVISVSNSEIKVWDLESRQELRALKGESTMEVCAMAVTPDGKTAVTGHHYHSIKVWDLTGGQGTREFYGDSYGVEEPYYLRINAIALTPDGKTVISALHNSPYLEVWDLERGQEIRTLGEHSSSIHRVELTADGKAVVSASDDNTLKVWELASGRELCTLKGAYHWVDRIEFSSENQTSISTSSDNLRKVLNLANGYELLTLQGYNNTYNKFALTPNRRIAASVSGDSTLKVWDKANNKHLATFVCDAPITAIAITVDGRGIVAGDYLGKVHFLWLEGNIER